ncbi:MAG TPA: ACT domain-containing protein [Candidatus Norongarragalinales archaeon]|nr:ACT domain-containing protein [Candidatus Norongarragalinales archaeon]
MGSTREITVVARDRIGLLADITEALSRSKINIDTISAESSSRNAIIRILTRDAQQAKKVLEEVGFKVLDSDALVIGIPDRPGEIAKISRMMADHKINIESLYVMNKEGGETVAAALKTDNYDAARKLLRENKYI